MTGRFYLFIIGAPILLSRFLGLRELQSWGLVPAVSVPC